MDSSESKEDKNAVPKFSSFKLSSDASKADRETETSGVRSSRHHSQRHYSRPPHGNRGYRDHRAFQGRSRSRSRKGHGNRSRSPHEIHERREYSHRRASHERSRSRSFKGHGYRTRSPHETRGHGKRRDYRGRSRSRSFQGDRHNSAHKDDEARYQLGANPTHSTASRTFGDEGLKSSDEKSGTFPSRDFLLETKGDRSVLKYGTAHRFDTPTYTRFGSGQVLGLPAQMAIERDISDKDVVIVRDKNWNREDSRNSWSLSQRSQQPSSLFRFREDPAFASDKGLLGDYIAFSPQEAKENELNAELKAAKGGGSYDFDDDRYAYRSILGKAKDDVRAPEGMEFAISQESQVESLQVAAESRNRSQQAELRRQLSSHPADVAAWLRLVKLQTLIHGTADDSRSQTASEERAVADVKLGLLEDALKKCGTTAGTDLLRMELLKEGSKLWDRQRLLNAWTVALRKHPESHLLLVNYLNTRQHDFHEFSVDDYKSLIFSHMEQSAANPISPRRDELQCYLLLRLSLVLKEADYTELAVGLWQATLEFALFTPRSIGGKVQDTPLEAFFQFWDSEVARLGESKESGWQTGRPVQVERVRADVHADTSSSQLFHSWSQKEQSLARAFTLPARSTEDYGADVDTTFSVVLSSDIRQVLPFFSLLREPKLLVDAFLYFCGLPHLTVPGNYHTTRSWSGDGFLQNGRRNPMQAMVHDRAVDSTDSVNQNCLPLSFPLVNFLHNADTLLAPRNWFSSMRPWVNAEDGTFRHKKSWVRQTLRQLVERFDKDTELAEYALAVEFLCNRETANNYAKRLLRARSSNLRLYNMFALMQWRSGSADRAVLTWSSAIKERRSFANAEEYDDSVLLWNTWASELLYEGDQARSLHLLYAMAQDELEMAAYHAVSALPEYNAMVQLRLERFCFQLCERALAQGRARVFVACADSLALSRYISKRSLEPALEAYHSAITQTSNARLDELNFKAFTLELLHQSLVKLMFFHMNQKGCHVNVHLAQSVFKEIVTMFPHNTMFLSLFLWNESRLPITHRVADPMGFAKAGAEDRYIKQALSDSPPAVPLRTDVTLDLLSVHTALWRFSSLGGSIHAVRAAFEKSLHDQAGSPYHRHGTLDNQPSDVAGAHSSIAMWKLYLLFELDAAKDKKAAKNVLYRAIRACPWSKELVMLGIERLGNTSAMDSVGLSFDELRELYNLLAEKQLRIRMDLTERLAQWDEQAAKTKREANAWFDALLEELNGFETGTN
ncbi:Uncharacterized protein PECH_006120 [Penicillium ucsense]|uniref:Uncharacterized protein n=1 Tax=Penicillium ucsense TaxID=2839758 RepID=A0A8J8WGI9_9EURO|nr:Uncharacterized protein PECM_008204 [Penicillium ucsense]KAF7735869.1 Uncharacterized protein PECH_006120 [Penicillium ucsense]